MARKYKRDRNGQFAGGVGSSGKRVASSGAGARTTKKNGGFMPNASKGKRRAGLIGIYAAAGYLAAGPIGAAAGASGAAIGIAHAARKHKARSVPTAR